MLLTFVDHVIDFGSLTKFTIVSDNNDHNLIGRGFTGGHSVETY